MKVAQVIHTFPPHSRGGSEIYAYYLSRELAKRHKVCVFHRVANPLEAEYRLESVNFEGLEVYRVNNTWRHCRCFEATYRNDYLAETFASFLERVKPDIAHFHHLTCLSTTFVHKAKEMGIPVVFTLHDYWLICQRGQLLRRDLSLCPGPDDLECLKCLAYQMDIKGGGEALRRICAGMAPDIGSGGPVFGRFLRGSRSFISRLYFLGQRKALDELRERKRHIQELCSLVDLFICPSRFLMLTHKKSGLPFRRIVHSDNGMNVDLFRDFRRQGSKVIRFGYIGSIIPPKGLHILIRAFNMVKDDSARLEIHGPDIPYEGVSDYFLKLKGMVVNPNIRFMGEYDNSELPDILSGMDALIVPSIWYENSPLTIQEAFLAGVPVIGSDIGGIAERIRPGFNGLLFKTASVVALYQQIKRFIKNPFLIDKSSGFSTVKSIKDNAREMENYYSRLLSKKCLS